MWLARNLWYFFLVPGVGAQGGDIGAVCTYGMNAQGGVLINSARQIIYASQRVDFADAARAEAIRTRDEMHPYIGV